jgi:hypothetical protein
MRHPTAIQYIYHVVVLLPILHQYGARPKIYTVRTLNKILRDGVLVGLIHYFLGWPMTPELKSCIRRLIDGYVTIWLGRHLG